MATVKRPGLCPVQRSGGLEFACLAQVLFQTDVVD